MLVLERDEYVLTGQGRRYVNNVCKEFYVPEQRGKRQHIQFVPTITANQILYYAGRVKTPPTTDENATSK
jgi:oxygen-independent coproporphyrinogen-3 oxidase